MAEEQLNPEDAGVDLEFAKELCGTILAVGKMSSIPPPNLMMTMPDVSASIVASVSGMLPDDAPELPCTAAVLGSDFILKTFLSIAVMHCNNEEELEMFIKKGLEALDESFRLLKEELPGAARGTYKVSREQVVDFRASREGGTMVIKA